MVPSEDLRPRLDEAYRELRRSTFDVHDYKGRMFEAAFDLMTAETAVAGIADTLLTSGSVPREHVAILRNPILTDTRYVLPDGTAVDLKPAPALLQHARLLDEVRRLCLRLTDS
jgi:hypothetical protein